MKITGEGARSIRATVVKALSLSLWLSRRDKGEETERAACRSSPLGSPDLVGASFAAHSQNHDRSDRGRSLNPVEGEKQATTRFAENGSVACGSRKKTGSTRG